MALNIISNGAAASTARILSQTSNQATEKMAHISSGFRVMVSKDDAASMAVGATLRAEVAGLEQTALNVGTALNILQTTDSAYEVIIDQLTRMQTLSIKANTDNLTDSERTKIDAEYQLLLTEIDRLSDTTNFNGITLLGGTGKTSAGTTDFNFRVGTNIVGTSTDNNITVSVDYINAQILAVDGTSVGDTSSADTALGKLRTAISTANASRAAIGANMNRLEFAGKIISISKENAESARSQLMDLDMPSAVASLSVTMIQTQAGFSMLNRANQLPEGILGLLR